MRIDVSLAGDLIRMALEGGADMAEVYQRVSRSISADAKEGRAEAVETAVSFGYGLRVIKGKRLGFSYANSRENPGDVARTAIEMASVSEEDEYLDLPEPASLTGKNVDVFDEEVSGITEQKAISLSCDVERGARELDQRVTKIRKASAGFSTSEVLITNSKGLSVRYSSTMCSGSIMAIAQDAEEGQMGWGFQAGRHLDDISFDAVGREAAQRAVSMLGARNINPVKAPVLLDSLVASEFLEVFAAMLSSEAVQKNRSLLKDRKGEKIVSSVVDITDDGLLPRAPGTKTVDDEGVPTGKTTLIVQGVLRNYLYNTHTARKENVPSTGNAARGGISTVPGVGPTNLFIASEAGSRNTMEMLSDIKKGFYITEVMGMHTVNPVSGHFSVGASGLWIENGEIAYPVKEAVISGNLLDFFSGIEEVGNDMRFYGNIGSPGLLFGETDISA